MPKINKNSAIDILIIIFSKLLKSNFEYCKTIKFISKIKKQIRMVLKKNEEYKTILVKKKKIKNKIKLKATDKIKKIHLLILLINLKPLKATSVSPSVSHLL